MTETRLTKAIRASLAGDEFLTLKGKQWRWRDCADFWWWYEGEFGIVPQ